MVSARCGLGLGQRTANGRALRRGNFLLVIRPGGKLVLGALAPSGTKTNPVFKYGFKFYEQEQIKEMLSEAGFSKLSIDIFNETRSATDGSQFTTDYFIASAHV